MYRIIAVTLSCLILTACGSLGESKIAQIDPKTGLLQSDQTVAVAKVVTSKKLALRSYKDMAVIFPDDFSPMNSHFAPDNINQLKAINFFGEVYGVDDLQKLVVSNNLQDKIMTLQRWSGLKDLYHLYKPFLVIHFKCVEIGNIYYRLIVTDPDTMENVFVSEVEVHSETGYTVMALLTLGSGMNGSNRCTGYDQDTRYPLFNSLIEWINQNR